MPPKCRRNIGLHECKLRPTQAAKRERQSEQEESVVRWIDFETAPNEEPPEVDHARGLEFGKEQPGNQKAGYHEEEINPNPSSASPEPVIREMPAEDQKYRHSSEHIERLVAGVQFSFTLNVMRRLSR